MTASRERRALAISLAFDYPRSTASIKREPRWCAAGVSSAGRAVPHLGRSRWGCQSRSEGAGRTLGKPPFATFRASPGQTRIRVTNGLLIVNFDCITRFKQLCTFRRSIGGLHRQATDRLIEVRPGLEVVIRVFRSVYGS